MLSIQQMKALNICTEYVRSYESLLKQLWEKKNH